MPPRQAWLFGVRPYALLIGFCLLLYIPGLSAIPPLDRDEARFAQATRQMLESGDFLHIRFQDEQRNSKPAGIYWLQAAAVAAFSSPESSAIWPYRIPSLVGATAAALLLFGGGGALMRDGGPASDEAASRRIAIGAAVLLAGAVGVVAEAHIGKTDAALLAAVTAGQLMLGLAYVRGRRGLPVPAGVAAAFWAAEIAAILLKGPVGPGLALLTVISLWAADGEVGWLRSLRPVVGLAVAALVVGPWLIAIEQATAGRFLAGSLGRDFLTKLLGAQESHGAPPFSYLLLAFATFWPGSLLLVPALVRAWRRHDRPVERFLLAWLVPGWILLELVPTKLPHYVLPLYPALALLAAAALVDGTRFAAATWARRAEIAGIGLWIAATLALTAALIGLPLRFGVGPAAIDIAGAALITGLAAFVLLRRPDAFGTGTVVAGLAVAFAVPTTIGVLPGLDRVWVSRGAAALVAQHPPAGGAPLVAVGYSEPSLVFTLGTHLQLATPRRAAELLGRGGEALVANREQAMFLQALETQHLAAHALGTVSGIDYSNGQRLMLTLYGVAAG